MTPDFTALQAEVLAEFPSFTLTKKSDSWFMRLLGHVFGQQFMTNYTTTIFYAVHVPDDFDSWDEGAKCAILRHERVHMRQCRSLTPPLFAFLYLLVFLPLGLAYGRAKFEQAAYAESLQAYSDYGIDYKSDARRAWYIQQFTSSAYGYMWPFPKTISKWFDEAVTQVKA